MQKTALAKFTTILFSKKWTIILFIVVATFKLNAQAVLNANGPGNTYELINSILAPGYNAVESPDQCASHPGFGRHVAEVFDATLNQFVFEFYMHIPTTFPVGINTADNDRCLSFDRQRVEIKTYDSSPDSLKGTVGETVTYKWRFRLPSGFQASTSFTHIHQVKAVDGDDDDPIFTLTPRAGSTNTLQLIYVDASVNPTNILATANLSSFLGTWVEVTEQIKVGANGSYSITINRVSDGASLLSYSNSNMLTIRSTNSFIRPKWGIYRSLNNVASLRDDSIRIASISIFEGLPPAAPNNLTATAVSPTQINLSWTDNATNETSFSIERSANGTTNWTTIFANSANNRIFNNAGLIANTTYFYRVRADNPAGSSLYTNIANALTFLPLPTLLSSFKATTDKKVIQLSWSTINEVDVKEYLVECSVNNSNFFQLATVLSKSNTSNKNNYNYDHQNAPVGILYYRLKIIDFNGSYQYAATVQITSQTHSKISIYPNPAKEFIRVQVNQTIQPKTEIIVLNANGKMVLKQVLLNSQQSISTANLTSGLYLIKIVQQGVVLSKQSLFITQ